jgi:hypothetical protein
MAEHQRISSGSPFEPMFGFSAPPAVPHIVFRDAAFRENGHFRERPESLTA